MTRKTFGGFIAAAILGMIATLGLSVPAYGAPVAETPVVQTQAAAMIEDPYLPGGPYHIKNSSTSDFGFRIIQSTTCSNTATSTWLLAGDKAQSTAWTCAAINNASGGYTVCVYDGATGRKIVCRVGQEFDDVRIYSSNDYIFYIRN